MPSLKLNVSNEFNSILDQMVQSSANSAESNTDVISRAVALYAYLTRQIESNPGAKVGIVDSNNNVIEVIQKLP